MNRLSNLLFLPIAFVLASGGLGQEKSVEVQGLDARLSDYSYPFDTHTYRFEAQRQELEMVYMDENPAKRSRQTVLLLHGKNFSGAYWETTIEALLENDYRVVVPDLIGFGKSSKPEHFQFTFQALAYGVKDLMDSLGVENVFLVGHSMGGMVATRFALMYPDFTDKLVLVNPIGLEDWKRVVPYQSVDEWYEQELKKTPGGIKQYMKSSYFDGEWKPAYDPLLEIQAGWTQGPDYPELAWISALTYDMIFTQPVLHEFGQLEMPTLLIIGQRDRTALGKNLVSPEIAETLGQYGQLDEEVAEMIPDSRLVELEGIGHIPQFEAFDEYREALLDFLGES